MFAAFKSSRDLNWNGNSPSAQQGCPRGLGEPAWHQQSVTASHVPAAPKGAGEGWEAWRAETALCIFRKREIFFSLLPQCEP